MRWVGLGIGWWEGMGCAAGTLLAAANAVAAHAKQPLELQKLGTPVVPINTSSAAACLPFLPAGPDAAVRAGGGRRNLPGAGSHPESNRCVRHRLAAHATATGLSAARTATAAVALLLALTGSCSYLADHCPTALLPACLPAELTELEMQDSAAQQDTIPAGLSQQASVA